MNENETETETEIQIPAEQQLLDLYDCQLKDPDCLVPTAFVTGVAGTGKTYLFRELLSKLDPKFAVLASTTGIAAVNMGTTTVNSLLKYFDTAGLEDNFVRGKLGSILHKMGHQHRALVIDEVSMMDGKQLDLIYRAVADVNGYESMTNVNRKLGLILTGDFCQLPPVKAQWVFEAECWPAFARNTIRLTKIWRQGNEEFVRALHAIRSGEGETGAQILANTVHWVPALNRNFDGTTIVAKNDEVDRHNWLALQALPGEKFKIPSRRRGQLRGEWKNVPEMLELKVGAYVMILSNSQQDAIDRENVHDEFEDKRARYFNFNRKLSYANGDCGWIVSLNQELRCVEVELTRTGETVNIFLITRRNESKEEPDEYKFDYRAPEKVSAATPEIEKMMEQKEAGWIYRADGFRAYFDDENEKYVLGEITYLPLRLAYAATVHKTQGLTLDKIQIDARAHFFGSPAMAYVALSRARSPENVYIVGSPKMFASKCKIDEKVIPWL